MPNVNPIPTGYHTVTPYMTLSDAAGAIEFYKKAFGATEVMRMPRPDGKIGHAEIKIGNSHVMLSDEMEQGPRSPLHGSPSPVGLLLYMPDVDSATKQAEKAGAKITSPPTDQFYGDRAATLKDPFGYQWHIHTHIKDVSQEEMRVGMKKQMEKQLQHA